VTLTQLGPYPIEREVGRGGMGVVYLGRDTRLDRPVAIKVLPELFARDPERLARFEREARLLASLSHPNIAGIYGLDESDGQRFLALEYVEGETLAERLARGPLSLEETLEVCHQIAGALEAAHEAGIVHRDLKPGNVKLTPAGAVKVLDFGLAKGGAPSADSAPDLSQSPTMTYAMTSAGMILGTAAYMSPEQARGKPVDRRTDIWSFGCLIYECLTGKQAFEGETVSDLIAMILQGEPDWSKLPARTPEKLRVLLARCLERDARRRLRDMGDARIELEELQGLRSSSTSRLATAPAVPVESRPAAIQPRWQALAFGTLLLAAGAIAGASIWGVVGSMRATSTPLRFMLHPPPQVELTGDPNELAISPDGRTLVFLAQDSTGQVSLWVRPFGSFEARELPGTRNAFLPFWSPDGKQVGFFADGKLKRTRVSGGNPEVICDAATGRGASWGRRNVIVFSPSPTGPLYQVRAAGGTPEAVTAVDTTKGENAHRWPNFLPDGEHFTFVALPATKQGDFASYVGSLRRKEAKPILSANTAPIYAAPGYLIYARNEALLAQRFEPGRMRVTGDPFTIGEPPAPSSYTASPGASVSTNGILAWQSAGNQAMRLVWLDRNGRETGSVAVPLARWAIAILSHDGRHALVEQDLPSGDTDLWIVELERGVMNRLAFGQGKSSVGAWSRDDKEVFYGSTRNGPRDIYRRAADGSGTDQLFYSSNVPFKDLNDFSPDGKWAVLSQIAGDTGWDIFVLPGAGGSLTPYVVTPFNERFGQVSPDGKWLLYVSDETGTPQAYVQAFPTPGSKRQVSRTGAAFGTWSANGREIYLLRGDFSAVSVPVIPGPEPRFGAPQELYRLPPNSQSWDVALDGRFLATVPAQRIVPGISVAVNWRAGRKE
jgi:Tol biopolymer transport system component/predicted Ser/Thr protein kinase